MNLPFSLFCYFSTSLNRRLIITHKQLLGTSNCPTLGHITYMMACWQGADKTQLHGDVQEKTLMQAQAYTSDRTYFTLSSNGTTKITVRGEGGALSARKGERSSLTRLLMDPDDHCSLWFLSNSSQSWFRASQQGRLTAVPCPKGQETARLFCQWEGGSPGKLGLLLLWLPRTGRMRGRHLS